MRSVVLLTVLLLAAAGCGLPAPSIEVGASAVPEAGTKRHPLATCQVADSSAVVELTATRDGVVFGFAAPGAGVELQRFAGTGCALKPDGSARIAVKALLDADDRGNIYAFPRSTTAEGLISTMASGGGSSESMVAKVDPSGQVSTLVHAGRGIWSFGISPEGGSLWVTACGPNGIFAAASTPLASVIAAPQTQWSQRPNVLTSDRTFWSVGHRTCAWDAAVTPACGFALVRTTPEGSREVGTTVVDVGVGFEQAALARCGTRVCGVLSKAVVVWGSEGAVLKTILPGDLGMLDSERVAQVSGNQLGVYSLLHGSAGTRVVFVPVHD